MQFQTILNPVLILHIIAGIQKKTFHVINSVQDYMFCGYLGNSCHSSGMHDKFNILFLIDTTL